MQSVCRLKKLKIRDAKLMMSNKYEGNSAKLLTMNKNKVRYLQNLDDTK